MSEMSSEKRFCPNLMAKQHNPNSNLQLQECKISNTLLILHYKDIINRWKESKSSQPLQIAREIKIDNAPKKSVSLIFKEQIKFPMHHIKHKFFMHTHKTAREEGQLMSRYTQESMRPSSSRGDPASKSAGQSCAAECFRPWPSIKGVQAVRKHESAREGCQDQPRNPQFKGSLTEA